MFTKLILADDNPATRSALAFILNQRLGLGIAGEAASMEELLRVLRAAPVEAGLLVLDWELPGLSQAGGVAALRALRPNLRIVALSARAGAREEALAAGADAFVSMVEPPEMLLAAVNAAAALASNTCPSGQVQN